MEEIVVYVHGKGGSAQEAEHYKALFPNCEVIGFDYHAQSPWEATEEFSGFFTAVRKRCGKLTLVANSIGAFLSLSSLNEKLVDIAYFISPVVDMEQLICNMMQWADVSEAELAEKLEIPTTFGEKTDRADALKIANYALTFWDTLPPFNNEEETRLLLKM